MLQKTLQKEQSPDSDQIVYPELTHIETFEEVLDEVESFMPSVTNITDENSLANLSEILENEAERAELITSFELLACILEQSSSLEEMATEVDSAYQNVMQVYEENIMTVFEKTKPYEKTIRSLNLLYENAMGEAEVFILPVNAAKFADSTNPKHFERMRDFLQKQFYAFRMEDSPFYISFVGDIGSKSAMDKMAEVAFETRALAVLNTKDFSSLKAALDHAKRLRIKGIPNKLGHLVLPATWVYALGAKDVKFVRDATGKLRRIERKMSVPSAASILGKLLSVKPGVFITGMEADALMGIDGVVMEYDKERLDAKALDKAGLIMIEPHGHIQGASTANNSNQAELRKFPKVDTANALLKDLVQYCNNKAFSKWGKKEDRGFKREIELYLNRRVKQELIEGYDVEDITYDAEEEIVNIDITVHFSEVADEFEINMKGPQGGIDVKKDK
jgi:hypothetical protein